jgi:hypothetical protein
VRSATTTSSASTNSVRSNLGTSFRVSGAVRKPEGENKDFRPPCLMPSASVAHRFNVLKYRSLLPLIHYVLDLSLQVLARLLAGGTSPSRAKVLSCTGADMYFIFGLYRGVWHRRRQEFAQAQIVDFNQRREYLGNVGHIEARTALETAGGAALVVVVEAILVYGLDAALDFIDYALRVFIGSFLFFVFALLIGVATGRPQEQRVASASGTRGGRLGLAAWWNPKLIFGLVGTIITAIATVYDASVAG